MPLEPTLHHEHATTRRTQQIAVRQGIKEIRRVLFGLGDYSGSVSIDVQWCGIELEHFADLEKNHYHRIAQKATLTELTTQQK